jgi:hypothetical protein
MNFHNHVIYSTDIYFHMQMIHLEMFVEWKGELDLLCVAFGHARRSATNWTHADDSSFGGGDGALVRL